LLLKKYERNKREFHYSALCWQCGS